MITLTLTRPTARMRIASFVRGLRRPRALAALAVVVLFPIALRAATMLFDRVTLADFAVAAATGVVGVAVMLAVALLVVAMPWRSPSTALHLDDDGIREVGRRTIDHPWDWVHLAIETDGDVTLYCEEAPRTFAMARAPRTVIVAKTDPTFPELVRLLDGHVPASRRRSL